MDSLEKAIEKLQKTFANLEAQISEYSSSNDSEDDPGLDCLYRRALPIAGEFASNYIDRLFSDDQNFSWNRFEDIPNSFDDLNFRYKNNVFSVLLQIIYNGEKLPLDPERKTKMLMTAKANNLIPCVFPIEITDSTDIYSACCSTGGFNLINLETNKVVDPIKIASNKQVPRSRYELLNNAILTVKDALEEQGFRTGRFFDDPNLPENSPRLWFLDENNQPCWVVIKVVKDEKFRPIDVDKIIKDKKVLRYYKGYYAAVRYEAGEKKVYRGVDTTVRLFTNVILKIYDGAKKE